MSGPDMFGFKPLTHQNQLPPALNKFHAGNGDDGKHYWLTPPDIYAELDAEFHFDFDPCPYPLPEGFDGLTCEWGQSSYVNPPFGSIIHQGKKKGPTAWVRKAIEEHRKGRRPSCHPQFSRRYPLSLKWRTVMKLVDYEKISQSHPSLERGQVWCRLCERAQRVDAAVALRSGWPKCCGYSMTIDHPDTWESHGGKRG